MKSLLLILLISIASSLHAQVAQISSAVSTGIVLEELKDELNEVVRESLDRADYTISKAALQALGVIDTWKETNTDLLNTAFGKIDETSQELFAKTSTLINQFNEDIVSNLETARQITENANQITESIPTAGNRSFILRYSPLVISPSNKEKVLIRLRGVNLEKSEPKITLKDGSEVVMKIVGPQEVSFWLPKSELKYESNESTVNEIEISHTTRDGRTWYYWPKYKRVKRTLLIGTLPKMVGTYTLTGVRKTIQIDRKNYTCQIGKFEGTNTNVHRIAHPLAGYKWDLRNGTESRKAFRVTQGGGESARCQIVNWNVSTERGISVQARCDEIREFHFPNVRIKAGYVHCNLVGPVYREVPTEIPLAEQTGTLEWNIDKSIQLPEDIGSFELKVKTYDGKEAIATNTFSNSILDIEKVGNKLIIRSKVPRDITN